MRINDDIEIIIPDSLARIFGVGSPKFHASVYGSNFPNYLGKISTGIRSLDRGMRGGVEVGSLTGFVGAFGSGKSQLCHQLAVMVQLPAGEGGLGSGAVYVDTEGGFRPERLAAMAEYRGLDPQQALEKTTYVRMREWKQLVRVLRGSKAKLLIVDSLSWLFRGAENRKEAYMLRSIMYSILALAVEWALKNRSVFVFTSHGYKNRSYGDPYLSLFSLLRLWTIRERESLRIFCCGREFRATITEGGVLEAD